MTFRQIDEIANNMTCPEYVKPYSPPAEPKPVGPAVKTESDVPSPPSVTVPRGSTPPPPATNPAPGGAWLRAPRPDALPVDSGVKQASGTTRRPSATVAPRAASRALSKVKTVDPKALEALETEVSRKLNSAPGIGATDVLPAPTASGSPVPNLTPAASLR